MFCFPVPLPGLLFGDNALKGVRGHLLAGLVAFHMLEFLGSLSQRSSWQVREADALWIEGPGVPG